MKPNFVIRPAATAADFAAVEQMQRDVWGFSELEILPGVYFRSVLAAGGVLLLAEGGGGPLGFVFGFPSWRNGRIELHSDMLAVREGHRDKGVGKALKLAQREKCLEAGIPAVTWTFDPLRSRNAHFNFSKLGVLCDSYRPDFYGEQTSSFLHAAGTDRLWVTWILNRPKRTRPFDAGAIRVPIPGDVAKLDANELAAARSRTREALCGALADGYVITGFADSAYILEKGTLEDF